MVKLTPKGIEWLTVLRDTGPQVRKGRGPVPSNVMKAGLTEWDYRDGEEPVTEAELKRRYGSLWFKHVDWKTLQDRITPAGRAALTEADGNG